MEDDGVDTFGCWFCDFESTDEDEAIKHYKKCFKEFFLKTGFDLETGKPVHKNLKDVKDE